MSIEKEEYKGLASRGEVQRLLDLGVRWKFISCGAQSVTDSGRGLDSTSKEFIDDIPTAARLRKVFKNSVSGLGKTMIFAHVTVLGDEMVLLLEEGGRPLPPEAVCMLLRS